MFVLAKVVGFVLLPSTLVWLALALACLLLWLGRTRAGVVLASLAFLAWTAIATLPVAALASAPLEDRFPRTSEVGAPDGIIVLGGAIRPELSALRGQPQLNEAGERMTEFVALALRFPAARLVFTGGSASLLPGAAPESAKPLPLRSHRPR